MALLLLAALPSMSVLKSSAWICRGEEEEGSIVDWVFSLRTKYICFNAYLAVYSKVILISSSSLSTIPANDVRSLNFYSCSVYVEVRLSLLP